MMDLIEEPERALRLLDTCTTLVINWLKAQTAAISPSVEGFLLLDDIVGFIGKAHYEEFAHPFLKRSCDAFPADWVKVYHNDASCASNRILCGRTQSRRLTCTSQAFG